MRAQNKSVYRRRRMVAAVLLVTAVIAVAAAIDWIGDGLAGAGGRPESTSMARVSNGAYVVRRGDTLWNIARTIQPRGDVRPLVDRLAKARGGAALRPGQRIVVP